ncbi:tumor necrosis factor receptor superfamily member 13C [Colius striatus]|uniref:tumor necrosis factor receptor superfamily member 13C n=1 Tax=Colius striatus TaxID=57412 RepID=UPI002B1D50E3|nr:tumor necrosis factor receptor superfamily member 13C [Colius striatus]
MREPGPRSHPAMSSAGKAGGASSCLSPHCFDLLTRSCVKCSDLFKDNTTEPTRTEPTSALAPTLSSGDLHSPLLIFGILVAVVFILTLSALCVWRRKRKAADEEAEANMDAAGPLPSPGCQDPAVLEGDAGLALAPCLHLNGGLKTLGPPGKAGTKRRSCCQGDTDGDIVLLSTVYPRHEECSHSFPLPATELGATALVTTKTTQNCA